MKKIDDGAIKRLALIVVAGIALANPVFSQTPSTPTTQTTPRVHVSGKVVDSDGKPLPGVSVLVQGTTTATQTAEDGTFKLSAPEGGKLSFTRVGMKYVSYALTGNKNDIVITMQADNKDMEEVVVVGYGTQKAKNVTGSIVSVDMKKLEDIPVSNVTEALRGQVPGLNVVGGSTRPGTSATMNIRQQFSFGKDNISGGAPLLIIDDVIQTDPTSNGGPLFDQLNLLDPSEIESITVLKDASAAIYGARASNGAVIVKTKRGKAGQPKISYAGKFETNNAVSHGKTMSAYDYGVWANRFNKYANPNVQYQYTADDLEAMKGLNYDWLKEAWSAANLMQHSVNVNGGTERATYFTGVSYFTQGANLGSQDFNKWTFRAGTDVKVANGLKLSATVSANKSSLEKSFTKVSSANDSYTSGNNEQADYSILLHMPKYIPWKYNVNGKDEFVAPAQGPYRNNSASGKINNLSGYNYFAGLDNGSNTTSNDFAYAANFGLQYDLPFIKGLSAKATYAVNSAYDKTTQLQYAQHLAASTNTSAANAHLYGPNTTWQVWDNGQGARVSYNDQVTNNQQINFYMNYNRSFGPHNITALAAVEKNTNGYEKDVQLYDDPVKGIYNGTSSTAGTLSTNTITYKGEGGTLSYLGRVGYNYNSKYIAEFLIRADASTKFAPTNYWGTFPSLSLGWVMSDESWFKDNVNWVNFLKLRGSIGRTGQDNIKYWKWMQTYTMSADKGAQFGTNGGTLGKGLAPDATPNADVRWDKTIKKNIGIDASVLRNRLSFSIDGYYDVSSDMLVSMASQQGVPITVGGGFAEQNYAGIKSWGYEVSATWKDKVGKVNYSIGMNFATGENRMTKYFPVGFDYPSKNNVQEGMSTIFPVWGYKVWRGTSMGDGILRTQADIDNYWNYLAANGTPSYLGITDKTNMKVGYMAYQDIAGDKDDKSKTISGPNGRIKADEDFAKLAKKSLTYGINTNLGLSWKGVSFAAQIATSWGGYRRPEFIKQSTGSSNMLLTHESYLTDTFDPDNNPNGKYPNVAFYDYVATNSDFWSLPTFRCYVRNLSVGYTLPGYLVKKARLENAKVIISGNNLWDFYNPYPDKYRNMYDASTTVYPTLRTWALGINLSF